MSNPIVAAVRTVIQALVALVVVAVANYVLVELGVTIDAEAITETISLFAFGLIVWAFNALGAQFPIVNTVLSLGLSTTPAAFEV